MKEQLDDSLKITIAADQAYMQAQSPEELQKIMDEVTFVKIKALEELTDEKLRSDQLFLIFLTQCHDVISKIQTKMDILSK